MLKVNSLLFRASSRSFCDVNITLYTATPELVTSTSHQTRNQWHLTLSVNIGNTDPRGLPWSADDRRPYKYICGLPGSIRDLSVLSRSAVFTVQFIDGVGVWHARSCTSQFWILQRYWYSHVPLPLKPPNDVSKKVRGLVRSQNRQFHFSILRSACSIHLQTFRILGFNNIMFN